MNVRERLKARDALLRKYRREGRSEQWIKSWLKGWNNRGFKK